MSTKYQKAGLSEDIFCYRRLYVSLDVKIHVSCHIDDLVVEW